MNTFDGLETKNALHSINSTFNKKPDRVGTLRTAKISFQFSSLIYRRRITIIMHQ